MIKIKVEKAWKPTKIRVTELDEFQTQLLEKSKDLEPGESIPLPIMELRRQYAWKNGSSCANAIRALLKGNLSQGIYGRLGVYLEKSGGRDVHVRIMRKNLL